LVIGWAKNDIIIYKDDDLCVYVEQLIYSVVVSLTFVFHHLTDNK